jgi:hypothetical protein
MQISGSDQALWLAGFIGEASLAVVLLARREYRRFPIFFVWLVLLIVLEPILFSITRYASTFTYYRIYPLTQILDFSLQSGVLIEVASSVLKPQRPRISNRLIFLILSITCIAFFTALIWILNQTVESHRLFEAFTRIQDLDFLFAFLRLLLFALIAGFSQMLGITWRNHVIRLAAGLAFYSAISLIVQLSISHLAQGNSESYLIDYSLLKHTQMVAYLCALSFWVWSFVQKDAPRREFTPQMQKILVTISQAARRDRVGLTRSMGHK